MEDKSDRRGRISAREWLEIAGIAVAILVGVASFIVAWAANRNTVAIAKGIIHEDDNHDLVARVLNVTPEIADGYPGPGVNVDITLINRGNKSEVVRTIEFGIADSKDFSPYAANNHSTKRLNLLMPRGDVQVVRITERDGRLFGAPRWIGIAITAISPDARDLKRVIPICPIDLQWGGSGRIDFEEEKMAVIQVISNAPAVKLGSGHR